MGTVRTKAAKARLAAQAKKDSARICGATKRNGQVCGREAGWGTVHHGRGRCKHHAGSTRTGVMAAVRQETHGMATPVNVSPGQALGAVMRLASGQLLYASHKVSELSEDELFVDGDRKDSGNYEQLPNVWLAEQRRCMADVARFAKLAADAGIAERQTNLQEQQTAMIAQVMEAVMDDLGLSASQRKQVGPALRKHLTLVEGTVEEVA